MGTSGRVGPHAGRDGSAAPHRHVRERGAWHGTTGMSVETGTPKTMPTTASHALPYLLFVALGAAAEYLPAEVAPWVDPLRAVAVAAALWVFHRRGRYAELSAPPACRGATALALAAGLAVGLFWIPLTPDALPRFGDRTVFDPAAAGAGALPLLWAARLAGLVILVPLAEELFVRSLLPRWVDASQPGADWRTRPPGSFTALSAGISIAFFTATHPEWLAALLTAVLWTGLLWRTRRLRDAVLAHAVANAVLAAWVLTTGDLRWI